MNENDKTTTHHPQYETVDQHNTPGVAPQYVVPPTVEHNAYYPARRGMSTSTVVALLLGVVAVALLAFYFFSQQTAAEHQAELQRAQEREAAAANKPAPPPVIIQQQPAAPAAPAQQPPVVIERQAPPVVINQTAPAPTSPPANKANDDTAIQSNISGKLAKDPELASLGISTVVADGKVILTGSVNTPELKRRVERMVKDIKGVRSVDNQITVLNS